VRIISPLPVRVKRVASAQDISASAALAQIEASDRTRQTYLHRFYQVRWDDPTLYHLVLNTAHYSPEQAARLIQAAMLEMRRAASLPNPSRSIS
jgi:cytidylate kinase